MPVSNPRRTNGSRRDKVRAQVLAEEDLCHLCGKRVDKSLTMAWGEHGRACRGDGCAGCRPHPMRAEVDEIIPVSRGGSPFDRSNCRLSHRRCNRLKGSGSTTVEAKPEDFPWPAEWADLLPIE